MKDDSANKLDAYLEALANCTAKEAEAVFRKVADNYEDDLLEYEDFSADYFEFVLRLLSQAAFYSKPGLWNFLLVLGTERHKLLRQHCESLGEQFVANYDKYANEDLCLAVCDFIARNYPFDQAKTLFDRLSKIENKKGDQLKGFVVERLRILAAEEKRSERKTGRR